MPPGPLFRKGLPAWLLHSPRSFGVVMWELETGQEPYGAMNYHALMVRGWAGRWGEERRAAPERARFRPARASA